MRANLKAVTILPVVIVRVGGRSSNHRAPDRHGFTSTPRTGITGCPA